MAGRACLHAHGKGRPPRTLGLPGAVLVLAREHGEHIPQPQELTLLLLLVHRRAILWLAAHLAALVGFGAGGQHGGGATTTVAFCSQSTQECNDALGLLQQAPSKPLMQQGDPAGCCLHAQSCLHLRQQAPMAQSLAPARNTTSSKRKRLVRARQESPILTTNMRKE